MHSTSEIEAIIRKAKRQRADFIGSKIHRGVLPAALVALLSLAILWLAVEPGQDEAQPEAVAQIMEYSG